MTIHVAWRADDRPDLGPVPTVAARAGIDLAPVDPHDPIERRWLRALVWPENRGQAARLTAALELVADDPPDVVAGDATDGIAAVADRLAADAPLVVFHAATRAHVPPDRRVRFDAALAAPAQRRHAQGSAAATLDAAAKAAVPAAELTNAPDSTATGPIRSIATPASGALATVTRPTAVSTRPAPARVSPRWCRNASRNGTVSPCPQVLTNASTFRCQTARGRTGRPRHRRANGSCASSLVRAPRALGPQRRAVATQRPPACSRRRRQGRPHR